MKLLKATVPNNWNLYCIGDTHIGSQLCNRSALLDTIEVIKADKLARVAFMGDGVEGIRIDDRRYDSNTVDPKRPVPLVQSDDLVELLYPIKEKFICYLYGNHEATNKNFGNLAQYVCNSLGIPDIYGTFSCKVSFVSSGQVQFKGFFTHGKKSVTSNARDPLQRETQYKIKLKNLMGPLWGDCLLMVRGHNHRLIISEPAHELYLYDNGKIRSAYTEPTEDIYIHPDMRWYGCAGSFYRLYGDDGQVSYAEEAEYPPNELGYIKFEIRNGRIVKGDKVVV